MTFETKRNITAGNLHESMTEMLSHVGGGGESSERLSARLTEISEATHLIAAEHEGMAQELLCVYEQLGTVFEVTRQLASVQHESQVVDLFVQSLRRSFQGREVLVVPDRSAAADEEGRLPEWIERAAGEARRERRVAVVTRADEGAGNPIFEVLLGPVFAGEQFVCTIVLAREEGIGSFVASDMLLLESLTMFCGDLIRNHRLVYELREMSVAMVRSLVNAVDQKDEYTSGHSVRVAFYAQLLGRKLGLPEGELTMLNWSALLHDVGKIGIRDDVLKKAGRLTDEEFDHIKEHPVRSHKVVQEVPQLAGALDGVLYHHERFDGSGYPSGLAGEAIPFQARVVQVADVFDALTSNRAYRAAHPWEKALAIMAQEAGRTLDPQLQSVFDDLIRRRLSGDSDGWEKLFRRACRFTQTPHDQSDSMRGA